MHLTANVLTLPFRQPTIIARSAASLDILSGGRAELGLGSGGFWDAIEASGGRRLTPGQAVDALEEAITVIHEVWATDLPGGVHVQSTWYTVDGAKCGPSPMHNIGGTFGTNATSLLNGPPSRWIDDLATMTLTYGMSGFILSTDDGATIQRYAEEVAPADAERAFEAVLSLKLVDCARVCVLGISPGGGISLAVSGLVPNLAAVVARVPFLCDFPRASVRATIGKTMHLRLALSVRTSPDI